MNIFNTSKELRAKRGEQNLMANHTKLHLLLSTLNSQLSTQKMNTNIILFMHSFGGLSPPKTAQGNE
jgi:hypothetical protein